MNGSILPMESPSTQGKGYFGTNTSTPPTAKYAARR